MNPLLWYAMLNAEVWASALAPFPNSPYEIKRRARIHAAMRRLVLEFGYDD